MKIRLAVLCTALIIAASLVSAQQPAVEINGETPEGALLQQAGSEEDPAKKVALLEEFLEKYPTHANATYASAIAHTIYLKMENYAKALEMGARAVTADPSLIVISHGTLKAAEALKNTAENIQWAHKTSEIARKAAAEPKPSEEDEVAHWKDTVDYAQQMDVYTEYSLFNGAIQAADDKSRIAFAEALEAQNPESRYIDQVAPHRFAAYQRSGDTAKALAFAEKRHAAGKADEEMLLVIANTYFTQNKEPEKVVELSGRMAQMLAGKPKPEGVAEEDWNKRKNLMMGLGYLMSGVTYNNQGKAAQADGELRKALPLIRDNEQMAAQTLFYLGISNYRIAQTSGDKTRAADGLNFSKQCAAIKGPFQASCQKNVKAMSGPLIVK